MKTYHLVWANARHAPFSIQILCRDRTGCDDPKGADDALKKAEQIVQDTDKVYGKYEKVVELDFSKDRDASGNAWMAAREDTDGKWIGSTGIVGEPIFDSKRLAFVASLVNEAYTEKRGDIPDASKFASVRWDKVYAVQLDGCSVEVVLSNGERLVEESRNIEAAKAAYERAQKRVAQARQRSGSMPECLRCDHLLVKRGSDYYCGNCDRKYKDWEVANRQDRQREAIDRFKKGPT